MLLGKGMETGSHRKLFFYIAYNEMFGENSRPRSSFSFELNNLHN